MRTPSLRRRVVGWGVAVVVVVVASTSALLHVAFRAELRVQLRAVLDERVRLVTAEAMTRSPEELAARLTQLGLRATVRSADGRVFRAEPPSAGVGAPTGDPTVSRSVSLPDGSTVTVFASRAGVDDAARELLILQVVAFVGATLLATALIWRTSKLALRPLREIAASARRTSAGERGERLQPDRPHTTLGALATAYDEMLESLETAVREANEAQAESERLYVHLRQTIETANAAFVAMDSAGTIVEWNSRAEETFGWCRREAVGRSLAETLIPPDSRAAHSAGLRRFLEKGESRLLGTVVEMPALHRDGRLITVEVSTWVTYNGDLPTFNGFIYDISDRIKGQEATSRLAAIVGSAQEAIFSTTLDGTIISWNKGATNIYQFTPDEAIGQRVSLIIPPDRMEELRLLNQQIRRGDSVPLLETVRRRKDGSEIDVAVTVSPIFDGEGNVIAASTIARDVTDQRTMAAQLRASLTALEFALEDAKRSEERSLRFLADAAHQLRSPIAGLRACAETLLLGTAGDDHDRLLASLVRETYRAGRLIKSLLRLAYVDQGYVVTPEKVHILELCESELDRARTLASNLDVVLEFSDLPEEQPELDQYALREILSNLLDNARRHTVSRIELFVWATGRQLHIRVADDGPGIPEEAVEHVFERFVSLDGRGGSGLGLSIARALARAHGGDLTYDKDGFLITLPLSGHVKAERAPRA